jgi:hypothetical protein
MSLHDNDLEEQPEKAGQQPAEPDQEQKAKFQEQIRAADLKAWEPLKAELIQKIEKELRPKWEDQLYKQRQAGASGFDLTLGGGYSESQRQRSVKAAVDLAIARLLKAEEEKFFEARDEERKELKQEVEQYGKIRNRASCDRNYDELKTRGAEHSSFGREDGKDDRAAQPRRGENHDEPKTRQADRSSDREAKKDAQEAEATRGEKRDDGQEMTDAKQRRQAHSDRHPSRAGENRRSQGRSRDGRGGGDRER